MSYEQSASVYDAIYEQTKDYAQEAELLHRLIEQLKLTSGNRLLDIACGTGLHDQYLQEWYEVEGLDLSEAQLAIARHRLPDMMFYQDNMISFDLGVRYDIITCLFSAIGHLKYEELQSGIANMARHLLPGGVILVEPWLQPNMWQEGHISIESIDLPDLKAARICRSFLEGRTTRLEMSYLVGRPQGTEHFTEVIEATLFTQNEYLEAFKAASLDVSFDPNGINNNGRGIFIARKPIRDWTTAAMQTATPLPIQGDSGEWYIPDQSA